MPGMYAFDTLAFSKKLKSAGYTEPQAEALAEAQSEVFREMLESTLATKEDLRALETSLKADIHRLESNIQDVREELKRDIQDVRSEIQDVREELKRDIQDVREELKRDIQDVREELKRDIHDLRTELKGDIRELRADLDTLGLKLTIRLGAVVVAAMGAMGVIFRLFLFPGG